ncbi:hypothetical protein K438DRAFT_1752569 [Mycena galopus ATCC 62051]|nr:hypothetical protein K438DRAFT_1752569 [Mycena galopus ATCC 62051]
MSTTLGKNTSPPSLSSTLPPHEQIDLGELPYHASAQAHCGSSSSAANDPNEAPADWRTEVPTLDMVWQGFVTPFFNDEMNPVKVTPTLILTRAWTILQIFVLGAALFFIGSGRKGTSENAEQNETSHIPSPRVKLSAWRILNSSVLLILGTYKAVATYLGQTLAPSDLDWTIGLVWALISYWLSILEQEAPSVAPWFFTTDLSGPVRFGAAGSLVLLCVGVYWAVIYGIMASLVFAHPIHWNVLRAFGVGIVGIIAMMLIGLCVLALSMSYGVQLRKFLRNDLRMPRFPEGLFRGTDWSWQWRSLCIYTGVFWLSPIGMTFMLATRPRGLELESEVANMVFLAAAIPCLTIYGWVLLFLFRGADASGAGVIGGIEMIKIEIARRQIWCWRIGNSVVIGNFNIGSRWGGQIPEAILPTIPSLMNFQNRHSDLQNRRELNTPNGVFYIPLYALRQAISQGVLVQQFGLRMTKCAHFTLLVTGANL